MGLLAVGAMMMILALFYMVTAQGGLADILKWLVGLRKLLAQGGCPPEAEGTGW